MRGRWIIQRWAAVLAACLSIAAATALAARGGDLDPTFGDSGKLATDLGVGFDGARATAIDSQGRIVIGGSAQPTPEMNAYTSFALARILPDGSPDQSFGVNGVVRVDFGHGGYQTARALTLDGRGRILAGGGTYDNGYGGVYALARFLPDGALDDSFGGDGKVSRSIRTSSFDEGQEDLPSIASLEVASRGSISAAGTIASLSNKPFALRFLRDGHRDPTFGETGSVVIRGASATASDLVLRPSGTMDLIGYREDAQYRKQLAVSRLDRRGRRSRNFGRRGIRVFPGALGHESRGLAATLDGERRLIVAGLSSRRRIGSRQSFPPGHPTLIRMQPGGELDRSFGRRGALIADLGGEHEGATAVTLDAQGRIIVGGYSDADGKREFAILRRRRNGRPDRTFGARGHVVTGFAGAAGVLDVAEAGTGRILAGGSTSAGRYEDRIALARYRP